MTGDCHAGICGSPGVRFPRATRHPTAEEFVEIWRRVCAAQEIPYREAVIADLIRRHYIEKGRDFHGSHPRDLLEHVVHLCRYLGREPELTTKLLDEACETYFVDDSVEE